MPVYKDGKKFYFTVNYKDLNGSYKKYKSKRYDTKREAEKAEAEYRVSFSITSTSSKTFNDMITEYLVEKKKKCKQQTVYNIQFMCEHISKYIGNIKIDKLTMQQYEMFKKEIDDKGFSLTYKNKIHNIVIACVKLARKRYRIYTDIPEVCGGFKNTQYTPKKKMDFYTIDEFRQFISVVDDEIMRAFFTTIFFCGLRIGEANALTWEDIDFENNTIDINKTVNTSHKNEDGEYLVSTPKTSSSNRILPMSKHVSEALKVLQALYSSYDGYKPSWKVFGGYKSLTENYIRKSKTKYSQLANIREIRIHDFRHSCASLLINNGANITVVAEYLGHADIKMTLNTYSHFYKSKLVEVVDCINNL